MWNRIPVWMILAALVVSAPALVRAETKSAFVVVLIDGHESMAKSDIKEPLTAFSGGFGEKSFDDVVAICRVHNRYKKFLKAVLVIEGRADLLADIRSLDFDATSRQLGRALSLANDQLLADPDPNRVRTIVIVHGGGNDGSAGLLASELTRAKDGNVVVHTVAFGDKADKSLLKKLSKETNGRYYQVKSVSELPDTLSKVTSNIDLAREDKSLPPQESFAGKAKTKKAKNDGWGDDTGKKPKKRKRKKRRPKKEMDEDDDDDDDDDEDEDEDDEEETKSKKKSDSSVWVWVLVILLILGLGAGGVIFFLRRRNAVEEEEYEESEEAPEQGDFDAGAFFAGSGGGPPPEPAPADPAPRRRAEPRQESGGSSSVVFEPTAGEGEQFEMGARATLVCVGRKAQNDLVLVHRGVSGRHAELRWDDGMVTLTDLGSTNGTFVNGNRVTQCVLESGDELRFDAVSFRVVYGSPPPSPAVVEELPSAEPPMQDRTMMLSEEQIQSMTPPQEDEPMDVDDDVAEPEALNLQHMFCLRHKNRIAQQSCDVCNRPYCSECLVSVVEQKICNKCRIAESNA